MRAVDLKLVQKLMGQATVAMTVACAQVISPHKFGAQENPAGRGQFLYKKAANAEIVVQSPEKFCAAT